MLLLRQRMSAAQPERFGAASKAHFIGDGAGWARFLAWLAVCATRAVMPYGILMLAVIGLTPAVIVLAAIGANIYWIALTTRFRTLLTVPARVVIVLALTLSTAACAGVDESATIPTPPRAPFSPTDLRQILASVQVVDQIDVARDGHRC